MILSYFFFFFFFFFFNDTATTEIYTVSYTLSLHDALPISNRPAWPASSCGASRSATCSRSEEHTSELQSQLTISYAVFCLKKKKKPKYSAGRAETPYANGPRDRRYL